MGINEIVIALVCISMNSDHDKKTKKLLMTSNLNPKLHLNGSKKL